MKRRRGVTVPATPLFGSTSAARFITSSDRTDTGKGAPVALFVKKKLAPAGSGVPCLGSDKPRRTAWPTSWSDAKLANPLSQAMSMNSIITAKAVTDRQLIMCTRRIVMLLNDCISARLSAVPMNGSDEMYEARGHLAAIALPVFSPADRG